MPVITGRVTTTQLAAAATVENILADSAYEFLGFNALVEIFLNEDTQNDDIRMTVVFGNEAVMEEGHVSQQNRFPTEDDLIFSEAAPAGTRLKVRLRNVDAAIATSARFKVNLTPV